MKMTEISQYIFQQYVNCFSFQSKTDCLCFMKMRHIDLGRGGRLLDLVCVPLLPG